MDRVDTTESESKPAKRPRLHRGAWLVMLVVFVVWLLIALPGKRYEFDVVSASTIEFVQHGWPLVHFERASSNANVLSVIAGQAKIDDECQSLLNEPKEVLIQIDGRNELSCDDWSMNLGGGSANVPQTSAVWSDELSPRPFWTKATNWSLLGQSVRVRWIGLLGNLAFILSTLVIIGFVANFRFQRMGFRVSMKELGLLTFVAAAICMFYAKDEIFSKHRLKLEDLEVVKLFDDSPRYDTYPDCLIRLAGRKYLPDSNHFRSLVVDFSRASPNAQKQIKQGFSSLKHIRIAKLSSLDQELGGFLSHLRNVEELTLIGPNLTSRQWRAIGKMKQLEILRVSVRPDCPRPTLDRDFFDYVSKSKSLTTLELAGCDFKSDDLSSLQRLRFLTRLTLEQRPVDDQAIDEIEQLATLTYLSVRDGSLTNQQLNRLAKSRPKLLVIR